MKKFGVSERLACRVLGQHRSTQRKVPEGRADDAALTADIVALATQYGRYGYRRIAAMLENAGWAVNVKRVERIWRQEGLKVPARQPKKSRLWLADGSCIRLRPEYPNHVWSYDFVEDRTHNGRKFRMPGDKRCTFAPTSLMSSPGNALRSGSIGSSSLRTSSTFCLISSSCGASPDMFVRTMALSSSPRRCESGSEPWARERPSLSLAARGRTDTARASTPSFATNS